ncbi:glycosyltransferase family 2 protein [Alkalicoccus luteus]|uniref:Glycosyltransferase family 2 protein n=1 Tax=Alkalicoccus luteus TaxID=1237094 RepID=A0A969PUT3_9BACI|nr:glycosyltransferase [Alkalicoccus luteus]NJP38791.1 glycosyltransferase family 2 protein [Alkalicoccus luteus]
MRNTPEISVIVPVYNGESFLPFALESVLLQSMENFEIICINDGSSDGSLNILREYEKKDERIRVIDKENEGLAKTRNHGIACAKGTYIAFLDQDDYFHHDMLKSLYEAIKRTNVRLAMCKAVKTERRSLELINEQNDSTISEESILTEDEALELLFHPFAFQLVVPWNKLYHHTIFDSIQYPAGKGCDDEHVIHHIIKASDGIAFINKTLYYYYHNAESFMNSPYHKLRADVFSAYADRMQFFKNQGKWEWCAKQATMTLHMYIIHYRMAKNLSNYQKQFARDYKTFFKENKSFIRKKGKFELQIFYVHPYLHQLFESVRRKLSETNKKLNFQFLID